MIKYIVCRICFFYEFHLFFTPLVFTQSSRLTLTEFPTPFDRLFSRDTAHSCPWYNNTCTRPRNLFSGLDQSTKMSMCQLNISFSFFFILSFFYNLNLNEKQTWRGWWRLDFNQQSELPDGREDRWDYMYNSWC